MQKSPVDPVPAGDEANAPLLPDAASDHAHRWRIGAQAGPRSQGVCDCGAERSFANSHQTTSGSFRTGRISGRRPERS